ncbi:MAG TPA: response regulator [Kofleriaceae bacterium]
MTKGNARARRVLVVDDQPDTTAVLTVLFTLLGYETRSALRGREAIRLARDFDPELILLDIGLPDLNGYEVIQALRADSSPRARYIAAITGRGKVEDRERASRAGFDQYLVKPVDLATLRRLLQQVGERAKPPSPN